MKRLLYILFIFLSMSSMAQYRTIDWKTNVEGVVVLGTDSFRVEVEPTDFNDPGAISRTIGNYLIDFVGKRYHITDSTATTITVVSEERGANIAPQSGQIARVYRSIVNGGIAWIGGVDMSPLDESARWKKIAADNELFGRLIDTLKENAFVQPVDSITFDPLADVSHFTAYTFKPDTLNRTVTLTNDEAEVSMQLGQELWLQIKNDNGTTFTNGVLVYITGSAGGHPTVQIADNRDFTTVDAVGMVTHDIESATFGFTTSFGSVGILNTSGEVAGSPVYVDTLIGGQNWTTDVAIFPDFAYEVGFIQTVDAVNGKIFMNPKGKKDDILFNQNNANIIENFAFTVISDGTTVKGILNSTDGKDYLTVRWSDGFAKHTVPDTINLSAGTDANSQTSYAYIPKSTGSLTSSTSYFPIGTQYKTIAKIELWSALKTQSEGAKGNQNYNDYVASVSSLRGRIAQIGNWQRLRHLKYINGSKATVTVVTQGAAKDDVYLAVPQGNWSQANEQVLSAMDMQAGDDIHVLNYPGAPDTTISNLNEILVDATGATLAGRAFSFIYWIVQNKTGEPSHMYVNLPLGSYTSGADADLDESGFKVTTIPYEMQSYSGYVLESVLVHTTPASGTWTIYGTTDITGNAPGYGGGGGGSSPVSSGTFDDLTDTPSAKTGEGESFVTVALGETDLEYTSRADVQLTELDSAGFRLTASQISDFSIEIANQSIANDADNNFTIGFTLKSTTMIFYNNAYLPNSQWSGEGTTTLNIGVPTKKYDFIVINKN